MQTAPTLRFSYTSIEYMDFYELLKAAFIAKEWPVNAATPKKKHGIWLKQGEETYRIKELFEVNPEYFYDRYSRAKNGNSISMEERLIVAVLSYIAIEGRTFKQLNANFRNSPKRPSRKTNVKTGAIAPSDFMTQGSEWDQGVATVLRFYDAVNAGSSRHDEAWACLTSRLQHSICQSDFERFCEGYTNTIAIKNVKVFNVASSAEGNFECSVYYIDEIRNYRSKDLSGWDEYTVADLDEFVGKINKIRVAVETAGGRGFEKLELYKLFEPAASEYIWYKCRIKLENIQSVFPTFKHTEIKRLYRLTCKQVDNEWLIDAIRLLNVHSSR